MKSTGIVREVDSLGRVVIPVELRRTLALLEGTQMEFLSEGKNIIIRKYEPPNVEKMRTTFELEQILKDLSNDQQKEIIIKAIDFLKE